MKYVACVEYDGSGFSGWQKQKQAVRTVQASLERALSKVADSEVNVITAGRTDTAVHATHQVIHFESDAVRDDYAWFRGANRFLDHDVRVRWVQPVDEAFHARFSALQRHYRFVIYNHSAHHALFRKYSTFVFKPLSLELMAKAGECLIGEHDFSSFRASGCQAHSPVRTVTKFEIMQSGRWIYFDISANAFLQHMVRNIAGTLIAIGQEEKKVSWVSDLLAIKDRGEAGVTAPPHGLYLMGVDYPKEFVLPSNKRFIQFWS